MRTLIAGGAGRAARAGWPHGARGVARLAPAVAALVAAAMVMLVRKITLLSGPPAIYAGIGAGLAVASLAALVIAPKGQAAGQAKAQATLERAQRAQ